MRWVGFGLLFSFPELGEIISSSSAELECINYKGLNTWKCLNSVCLSRFWVRNFIKSCPWSQNSWKCWRALSPHSGEWQAQITPRLFTLSLFSGHKPANHPAHGHRNGGGQRGQDKPPGNCGRRVAPVWSRSWDLCQDHGRYRVHSTSIPFPTLNPDYSWWSQAKAELEVTSDKLELSCSRDFHRVDDQTPECMNTDKLEYCSLEY